MGNLKSIPEIRFPEFKAGWEHKPLNHYLKESKALNINLKYDKTQVLSVSGELGCVNQIEHMGRSYAGESVHNYGVVENGDIVYTKSPLKANPFGIVRLNTGKAGIVSTLYAVYKVKEKNATGEFIDYYFSLDANTNRYLRPLVRKGAKNDMKINNAYVLHDKIYAPSVEEQKRIAAFLKITDRRLAQLKEKKALLQEYRKGTMQKLFSQELRFKDENGNEFPEWVKKRLVEVCTKINSGKTPLGGESVYTDKGILFIRSQNVIDNKLSYEKSTYIPESINDTMKNSIVKPLDILLNITGGSLGRSCVVPLDFSIANVNQHVCIIRINNKNNPFFIQLYLATEKGQNKLFSLQTGSGREGLNFQSIKNLKISFPILEEQDRIANFLSGIDQKINICQNKIEETKAYKKSLLQKMFCV